MQVLAQESVTNRLVWAAAGLGTLIGVTLAHGIGLLDIGGVVVGTLAATLTWWLYRWRATWRLAPDGIAEAKLKPKRFRWTIRNLLVLTAASALLVQVALQVDFKQLMSGDYFDLSTQWRGGLITFLHAVVPIIVCFGPWSYVKRLMVLGLLLMVYWQIWDSEWERYLAIHLGLMSLAVCCILWLHGYRILRAGQPAAI